MKKIMSLLGVLFFMAALTFNVELGGSLIDGTNLKITTTKVFAQEGEDTLCEDEADCGEGDGGILIRCPPFGQDYGRCHVLIAEAAGWFAICRCDYTGITANSCSRFAVVLCN